MEAKKENYIKKLERSRVWWYSAAGMQHGGFPKNGLSLFLPLFPFYSHSEREINVRLVQIRLSAFIAIANYYWCLYNYKDILFIFNMLVYRNIYLYFYF